MTTAILIYNGQKKKTNLKPTRKKCKEYPYYKNYETKRRESGTGARIKHRMVRRIVKKFVKKHPEYATLWCIWKKRY